MDTEGPTEYVSRLMLTYDGYGVLSDDRRTALAVENWRFSEPSQLRHQWCNTVVVDES